MKRYLVLFALFVLSLITYIDRVAIASAKGPLAEDLSLSDQAMGMVFSAFALGYALAQIPSGWFADRFGPRLALAVVVSAWSLFTALTGLVQGLVVLLIVRFLFGIGEAGAFPGSARAIFNWLPVSERGRANGILFSGSRLGGAVAFPLLAWMLQRFGWRSSFIYLGVIGVVWAVFWFFWFHDQPDQQPSQNEPEVKTQLSFGQVLRSRGMILNMFQYFAGNFTFFICLSWMLPYLKEHYRLSPATAASYAMIPLLFGATAQWVAGWMVDSLYRSRLRAWSRRLPAIAGFFLAVAGMFAITQTNNPMMAVACFALATFGADMTISPSWAYCIDIGGTKSGAISGSMNMFGNVGSFVSANAFPLLHDLTGSANTYFVVAGLLNLSAIGCWWGMRPPSMAGGNLENTVLIEGAGSSKPAL
ncbi:MAG: MFS transporter [Acidobacteria bacterium]|nr:MFS transporter [Acidobacteriota bacterium]